MTADPIKAQPPERSGSMRTQVSHREWGALVAIVLLTLALRAWGLHAQTFSMDEISELVFARHDAARIIWTNDGFPPLYSLTLHAWLGLWRDDQAARWLSVLLGTLAIIPMWRLARRVGGSAVGIAAAFVLAVSPLHVWHSQEVRAYPLYFLLAVTALALFFRALASNRRLDWLAYAGAAVVGLYAHYYFALLIAAGLLIVAIERRSVRAARPALLAHAWMLPFCVPLLPLLASDLGFQSVEPLAAGSFSAPAALYTYFSLVAGYAVGPSTRELHTMGAARAIAAVIPWALLVGVAVVALGWEGRRVLGRVWIRRLAILALLPVALCGGAALALGIGYRVRYIIWAAIPLQLLLGAGLTRLRKSRVAALGAMALALVCGASLWNHVHVARYMTEDLRSFAAYLTAHSGPEVPVLVMSGYMAQTLDYYLGAPWRPVPLPRIRGPAGAGSALAVLRRTAPAGQRFWLVYTRPFDGDPDALLRSALVARAGLVPRASFAGVELFTGRGY